MARKKTAETPAAAAMPPAPAASPSGSRFLRVFLTIAGGLAAPALALAAFFLSGHGSSGAKTAQLGRVTVTTPPAGSTATTGRPATTTTSTTTTTAPVTSAAGLRDPFAPLVK